jgi:hypothetical protein
MATQAALRRSLWSESRIHYEHGRSPVTYVYRHDGDREEPWTVIAQSAILKRLGINGWGLYAAKPMKEGDYVGFYDGTLVGHYSTREAAWSAPETRRLLRRGHDKLVAIRTAHGPGYDLIDGHGAGGARLEMANDTRGTRLKPNMQMSEYGWFKVTRGHIPAFSLSKTIEENVNAELRWDYTGDDGEYWDYHVILGTRDLPIECD